MRELTPEEMEPIRDLIEMNGLRSVLLGIVALCEDNAAYEARCNHSLAARDWTKVIQEIQKASEWAEAVS